MIVHAVLAVALLAAPPPCWLDAAVDLEIDVEYSMYLDIYRSLTESYAVNQLSAFGPRASLSLRHGWLVLGVSGTLFPGRSPAGALDFFVSIVKRWRRLSLAGGLGVGSLFTPTGTLVPTYTDTVSGPTVHTSGALRWHLSTWFIAAGLAIYVYPDQPLPTLPVGVDLRWNLGLGLTLP